MGTPCLCPTSQPTGPVWAGVMQPTTEKKQERKAAERQPQIVMDPSTKAPTEPRLALSGSPFVALDATNLLWLVMERPIEEDDALSVALACRLFRDAVFEQYPRRPPGDKHAGKRILTSIRAAVVSVPRIAWMSALPDRPSWLPWSARTCMSAALEGDDAVLNWMRAQGMEWSEFEFPRIAGGERISGAQSRVREHMVLKWGLENQCHWNEVIEFARVNGYDFDRLHDWAISNFCDEEEFSCPLAAQRGDLAMLQWCREHGQPWKHCHTCEAACSGGDLETLKWLLSEGAPCADGWIVCDTAARAGDFEMLKWARENDYPWDYHAFASAARSGNVEMMAWMLANNLDWNEDVCTQAAKAGNLDALRWLRSQGAPWSARACTHAAKAGNLAVLQWLRENGCPWDTFACVGAASAGEIEMLQWLRANQAPWDWLTCRAAAEGDHSEVLEWAKEHGLQEEWARHQDCQDESGDDDDLESEDGYYDDATAHYIN